MLSMEMAVDSPRFGQAQAFAPPKTLLRSGLPSEQVTLVKRGSQQAVHLKRLGCKCRHSVGEI